jgi:penicillin amidase
MPGGSAIVNANSWDASKGYQVNIAPSMRMIVDLGDLDASRWVNQTGNSGHPYDAHYVDQTDAWVKNQTYPWPFSTQAVRAAGGDELILSPDGSDN